MSQGALAVTVALIDLEGCRRRGMAVGRIAFVSLSSSGSLSCSARDIVLFQSEDKWSASGCQTETLCRPSLFWPFQCLSLVVCLVPVWFQLFSFGFDTRILWNEGVLLAKALVGSCCGSNLGLAFLPLSVCIYPTMALVTFLCSRGRRNSHARHQVDTFICPNLNILTSWCICLYLVDVF